MNTKRLFSMHGLMVCLMVVLGLSVMMSAPLHVAAQDVAVEVGDSFTFVVNRYYQSVRLGSASRSVDKFTIDGKNPTSPGSDARITVAVVDIFDDDHGKTTIRYEVALGDEKANKTLSSWVVTSLPIFLSPIPFVILQWFLNDTTDIPLDLYTDIEDFIPYILPVNGTTDDAWNYLAERYANQTTTSQDEKGELTVVFQNSLLGGNFEAFLSFKGAVRDQTTNVTLTFNSKTRFVYEMATGVLQGYKTDTTLKGRISSQDVSIFMDVEINREGYQIEGFGGGALIPSFETPVFFLGLLAVTVGFSRIRKRQ